MDLSKILCDESGDQDGSRDLGREGTDEEVQVQVEVPRVLSQPQRSTLAGDGDSQAAYPNMEWSSEEVQCAMSIVHCADNSTSEKDQYDSSSDEAKMEHFSTEDDRFELLLQADEMIADCEETIRKEDERERKLERARKVGQQSMARQRSDLCVWTRQEEEYCAILMYFFLEGRLAIPANTTLPTYLAEQLGCSPRRIVTKLTSGVVFDQQVPPEMSAAMFSRTSRAITIEDKEAMLEMIRGSRDRWLNGSKENSLRLNESPVMSSTRTTKRSPRKTAGNPKIIRTGFESAEEEAYVTALYKYFIEGLLDISEDTRLGPFLCEQLKCSQRTLSMKLAPKRLGESKFPENLGTVAFCPKVILPTSDEVRHVEAMLKELRDSSIGTSGLHTSRSGPWSREEEVFAAALIEAFLKGVLDIEQGTTLRAFLSSRLGCNPMRISKKLASESIANVRIPKKLGSSTYIAKGVVPKKEKEDAKEVLLKLHQAYVNTESFRRRQEVNEPQTRLVRVKKHHRAEGPHESSSFGGKEQKSIFTTNSRKSARVENNFERLQSCPSRPHQPFAFYHTPPPYTLSKC